MEIIKVGDRLTVDERETILNYDSETKMWIMDSTVPKHFRKAIKQGWALIRQYVYEDGTVCGMVLTAPERSVTIRSTIKRQMSDKQMGNLHDNEDEDEE
jgi:hypothetical protein